MNLEVRQVEARGEILVRRAEKPAPVAEEAGADERE